MKEVAEYYKMNWKEEITGDYLLSRLNMDAENSLSIIINDNIILNMVLYGESFMYVHFFYKEVCIFQIHLNYLCLKIFRDKLEWYAERERINNIKSYSLKAHFIEELLVNR
jgi:hypothetical protein